MITNDELLICTSKVLNINKTTAILRLIGAGWDFDKDSDNQSFEVDEKVSQMLLKRLTSGVTGVPTGVNIEEPVEETIEVIEETSSSDINIEEITQESIEPVETSSSNDINIEEDSRYTQLLSLFKTSKTLPAKRRNKDKLVEDILDVIIPAPAGKKTNKGSVLKDKHKRKAVLDLIDVSTNIEVLASDLVSYIEEFKLKVKKRNKSKETLPQEAVTEISDEVTQEVEVIEDVLEEIAQEDVQLEEQVQITQEEFEVIEDVSEEITQEDSEVIQDVPQSLENRLKMLSKGLDVEYYITDNNKVYIVGRLGREGELSRDFVNNLRKRKKDIYFNLLQNKNLTVVQMFGFDDEDLLFAQQLLDENVDVQLVKGYKTDGMSFEAILYNSQERIKYFYESADHEVVIEGVHSKYSRKGCTQKQIDLFHSLGGEIIINNPKYHRVNATFTLSQMSTAIDLLKAGYSVILQDKYLKKDS
ncbi:hypothetical protein [Empedobacter sp. 189-2]|uniref:hypothetical protein n=1 Tax=Empedobacter sp. 189-2 TaxID=2746724 RepID=UPI002574CE98|nr:hypothetical protein [Empedobacter sp. 189-2]MDM1542344.1 hypothetical protein [Empedobacter sp. 189-2]